MSAIAERLERLSVRNGDCLLWRGSVNWAGYGRMKIANRSTAVHRVAYREWVGPIPDGLEIDHLCKVRNCIEPTHLEAVTRTINVARSESPGGVNRRKSECVNGHPFREPFAYVNVHGFRICRVCRRARQPRNLSSTEKSSR